MRGLAPKHFGDILDPATQLAAMVDALRDELHDIVCLLEQSLPSRGDS